MSAISQTPDEFAEYVDAFLARLGFEDIVTTLGLRPHGADGRTVSLAMDLKDSVAQANGMFAAAALFGAADITGTMLAMQAYAGSGQFPLAVQSNQNYVSNSTASPAVATARVVRGGSTMAVVAVDVVDADGKLLMTATFTYVLKERAVGR